jgi:DNA-binding PadR family transcriptional regulator
MAQEGWIQGKWGTTETNRQARLYTLTVAGRKQLAEEQKNWQRLTAGVDRVLAFA